MKYLILLVAVFCLSGCAAWEKMSDTERQAWIIGGTVVVAAALLAEQEDSVVINRDICFESTCEIP